MPSLKSARTRPREGVRVRLHTASCQHEISDVHRRCIPECVSKYTAQIEGQYQLCQTEQTLHRKTPKGSPADSASADSPTSFPSQQEYRRHSFPPFFLSLSLPPSSLCIMFSRAVWARQAAPLRRHAFAPLSRRAVTTDAASSQAESIPQVRSIPLSGCLWGFWLTRSFSASRRMISLLPSASPTRASRPTSSTRLRTLWRPPRMN